MAIFPNRIPDLEVIFPKLAFTDYKVTSPRDQNYNCIAWAAGINQQWWEPDFMGQYFWPAEVPRIYTLDAYVQAYSVLGYKICDSFDYEQGFEKIVIYVNMSNEPTHAARQLQSGKWTSKLGREYDISHDFESLNGDIYGMPAVCMKRPSVD
ncbi:MAG: hypothetical protein ACD_81C00106G0005 [uncultured bacterium]|uniref:DUF7689 domain-containing protein n=1 Tax=Candidatus Wolfebacteria bacterium GW2011_GWE2_44_13 TaxID=1619017 RepID=A0A0G1HAJ7_9BACT|nr:MAG: hypothetical protein ACD_81C00106G0005 [uncultured bacterium]KKT43573.1 MAG: hypothetical protein UW32_C0001G0165 [Candidatus Wolfebacteria bacterium GW2011_GWE2_44_13]